MKVDAFESEHYNIIKKKLTKAVQERTYVFLLTNFEEWFLSCMDKNRKIHLQCNQTEIRSKWICEIESPFLKPLQTEEQKMANFKDNIENHLQKIAETAKLKHQHSSRPFCSTTAYVKTSWWKIHQNSSIHQNINNYILHFTWIMRGCYFEYLFHTNNEYYYLVGLQDDSLSWGVI